jgi:hypothetical protein
MEFPKTTRKRSSSFKEKEKDVEKVFSSSLLSFAELVDGQINTPKVVKESSSNGKTMGDNTESKNDAKKTPTVYSIEKVSEISIEGRSHDGKEKKIRKNSEQSSSDRI